MNVVLKIVHDETALTSNVFEDRCRRLSKFCQSSGARLFFWRSTIHREKFHLSISIMAADNHVF